LNEEQIDNAGRLWTKLQLQDNTEVELYDGISFTVQNLNAYSQGIVSQNSSRIIKNNLEKFKLEKYFIKFCLAISKAGQFSLSLMTALTSTLFFSKSEFKIA